MIIVLVDGGGTFMLRADIAGLKTAAHLYGKVPLEAPESLLHFSKTFKRNPLSVNSLECVHRCFAAAQVAQVWS